MNPLQATSWTSLAPLRNAADAWDALWQRSEVTLPTARAALVAHWRESFAPGRPFHALAVQRDDQMLAALPLIGRRIGRLLPVGDLTWNYWSPNGELLLDPTVAAEPVLELLVDQIQQLPWPLLWLEMVPAESPRWQALLRQLAVRRLAVDLHPRYRIGVVQTEGDFAHYLESRPAAQLRTLRKDFRRLERGGPLVLRVLDRLAPEEVEAPLRTAFELEQRSWRTESGATVLDSPDIFAFYLRQAQQLAAWGQLCLVFLEQQGQPLAFELGWTAKGVYHSFKVGYDAAQRGFSPGHLLRMLLLEHCFQHPDIRQVDFQGPLSEAMAFWATGSYPIARVVIARDAWRGRPLLAGYRAAATAARTWRAVWRAGILKGLGNVR